MEAIDLKKAIVMIAKKEGILMFKLKNVIKESANASASASGCGWFDANCLFCDGGQKDWNE